MRFSALKSRLRFTSGFLFLIAILSGCATQSHTLLNQPPANLPRQVELAQTPFFPQDEYQCGPAALATLLTNIGISTHPDTLVAQVYVPERQGSLQVEMLATGRRQGAISMPIAPHLRALLTEVAAGNPVVVLQNLGLAWLPVWHYAVVIGYDLNQGEVILRSGTTERLPMQLTTFEHTWARSRYWGMVTLPPGHLPKTADLHDTITALVAYERSNAGPDVYKSYTAALMQWPDDLHLLMGAGNATFEMQDYTGAALHFTAAAQKAPSSAPALNNLALTLAHLGRFREARELAQKALGLGDTWQASITSTLRAIDDLQTKGQAGGS